MISVRLAIQVVVKNVFIYLNIRIFKKNMTIEQKKIIMMFGNDDQHSYVLFVSPVCIVNKK